MADGLNRTTLLGNLGADPELRMTANGNAVLRLRLATNESWLDRERVRQEHTEWHSVNVWGKRAEALAKILRRGSRVYVEGPSRTTSWEDAQGVKRWRTEIVARQIVLCDRAPGGSPAGAEQYDRPGPDDDAPPPGATDDDIPF